MPASLALGTWLVVLQLFPAQLLGLGWFYSLSCAPIETWNCLIASWGQKKFIELEWSFACHMCFVKSGVFLEKVPHLTKKIEQHCRLNDFCNQLIGVLFDVHLAMKNKN